SLSRRRSAATAASRVRHPDDAGGVARVVVAVAELAPAAGARSGLRRLCGPLMGDPRAVLRSHHDAEPRSPVPGARSAAVRLGDLHDGRRSELALLLAV